MNMPNAAYQQRRLERVAVTLVPALFLVLFLSVLPAFSQEDMAKYVEEKRLELKQKEEALKKEEERLTILRKDTEEKIERYTKLLDRLETALKKVEQINDERFLAVAKLYEAMTPEEAAAKFKAMDIDTAVQIMLRMKSKKAGAVIALLDAKRAVTITNKMSSLQIKKQ